MAAGTLLLPAITVAQAPAGPEKAITFLDAGREGFTAVAQQIWEYAEVAYQETNSSALLQQELRKAGFAIEAGIAGIPVLQAGRARLHLSAAGGRPPPST